MAVLFTLKELRDQVLAWLDETGDTGTTKTIANYALNQAHIQRCTQDPWPFMLWDTPETFTTAAGTQLYSLHQEFQRPFYFYDRTNKKYLVETPSRTLGPSGVRWRDDKAGPHFAFWGRTHVSAQPSASSVVTIVSTSASDNTTAYNITVRGVTANGVTTETITPNGTSSVAGTTAFTKILQITKAAAWNGRLTVTSNAGAVTILTLFPTEYGRSSPQLYLLSDPDGANVIEYRFYRQPSPLTNDFDLPDIPPPFAEILVWDTLLMIAGYNSDVLGAAISVWRDNQQRLELAMRQSLQEGMTIEAEATYIRSFDDLPISPRIVLNG